MELEDAETTGGRGRFYPDICGVVVDRKSALGRVVIYDDVNLPIQKIETGRTVVDELYAKLVVQSGQTCVVYGYCTVLYYKPRAAPSVIWGPRQAKARGAVLQHISNIHQLLN